jgi:hypothetical protein
MAVKHLPNLLLVVALSFQFASAQAIRQKPKPTDYNYKSLALDSVRDTAQQAKKLTEIKYKIRFLVEASALLSGSNNKEAADLLEFALIDLKDWESENDAPPDRRFLASYFRDLVIAQYLKIDNARATKLVAEEKRSLSDPDSKPLKNNSSWSTTLLERQSNADRIMAVALAILESDPDRAISLLAQSVQQGIFPWQMAEAFQRLRANRPVLLAAQERIAASLRSTVALDSTSVTSAGSLSWDQDMLPTVRATFLQFLLRSLEAWVSLSHAAAVDGGLDPSYLDSMFGTFASTVRPVFVQHGPNELGRFDLQLDQIAPQVSPRIRDMVSSNAFAELTDPRDRLTEIKKEPNPDKRDFRLLRLVMELLRGDDSQDRESLLAEAVQAVTDDKLKATLGDGVSLDRVQRLTKAQKFNDAAKAAERVTNQDLRAWTLLALSSVVVASDRYLALTWVNAAMKALEVSPATPRKVEIALLGVAVTSQQDPSRSFEIVSLVPKYANAIEESTEPKRDRYSGLLDEVSIGTLKIRPSSPPDELSDVRFDPAIRLLAKRDWFGVQKVADSIKDPALRLSLKLELAKGPLLDSANRMTPTVTSSQEP